MQTVQRLIETEEHLQLKYAEIPQYAIFAIRQMILAETQIYCMSAEIINNGTIFPDESIIKQIKLIPLKQNTLPKNKASLIGNILVENVVIDHHLMSSEIIWSDNAQHHVYNMPILLLRPGDKLLIKIACELHFSDGYACPARIMLDTETIDIFSYGQLPATEIYEQAINRLLWNLKRLLNVFKGREASTKIFTKKYEEQNIRVMKIKIPNEQIFYASLIGAHYASINKETTTIMQYGYDHIKIQGNKFTITIYNGQKEPEDYFIECMDSLIKIYETLT